MWQDQATKRKKEKGGRLVSEVILSMQLYWELTEIGVAYEENVSRVMVVAYGYETWMTQKIT